MTTVASDRPVGSDSEAVLSFRHVSKRFGATLAVDDVSVDIARGEIHALVGENGAGKSTLVRILAGDHTPDQGVIEVNGRQVRFRHPDEAIAHGVGFVHQVPAFVPSLSVTENLMLGLPFKSRRAGLIVWSAEHESARRSLANVGLSIDPRKPLERLRPHERQLVAVARAMKHGSRIIVLDEVSASLSEPEVRMLFEQIRDLREQEIAVIYVSHRLGEIFEVADRVTIMRDGKRIATHDMSAVSRRQVVNEIVGRNAEDLFRPKQRSSKPRGEARLTVRNLGDEKLNDVSFELYPGEIVGVSGLGASGRSRLLRILFGVQRASRGEIRIDGELCRFRRASDALAAGVALVTEDRIEDGFVPTLPIWQNVTLPWSAKYRRRGFMQIKKEVRDAERHCRTVGVRMPSIMAEMTQLSGGNQQKAIFARWISASVRVLLLDEPTHGVDIHSKAQIYDIIRGLAQDGCAILMASSELEEFEALCDRVLILRDAWIADEIAGSEINKDKILHALLA